MYVQGWFLSRIKLPFLVEKRWPNCSYSRQLCCVGSWIFFPSSRSATRHAVCTESVRFCRHIRSSISGHTFFLSPSSAVCHIKAATSVTTLHYAEHFYRLDISHSQSVRQAGRQLTYSSTKFFIIASATTTIMATYRRRRQDRNEPCSKRTMTGVLIIAMMTTLVLLILISVYTGKCATQTNESH